MELDELTIKRAASGNQEAFRKIVEEYQKLVFAICMNITKDRQEAENLAQETFLQVYRSLNKYRSEGFKTWIGRIATNKALDWKRSRKVENSLQFIDINDSHEIRSNERDTPHEKLLHKEEKERLETLCNDLPEKYAVVISKYYVQLKSYKQISDEEGISIKTVESRLYRAKKMLKDKWEEGEQYGTL